MGARVVTVSATFGSGGPAVASAVAARLGLPLVDRAIPEAVAAEIGCTPAEARAHDGQAETGIGRVLAGAARLPSIPTAGIEVYLPDRSVIPDEEFVGRTEQVLRRVADGDGGVILGRAAAVVLAGRAGALHVRLDGDREARLARVADEARSGASAAGPAAAGTEPAGAHAVGGTSQRAGERMLDDDDRARAAYVKHFYGADPADPRLYHLVIDTTRLPESAAVDLIVAAARAV
ncbi:MULTISPECIES: AAA family ATPase [Thermomonosporaceae]|uniref:cytidylate kinase-like family protein n=1 Tax=Thermomonosporaceae TaxID=2012 RepID=UPI00255AC25E|nr:MULTISPECIES: cytidylate kinase-like family protein [Thermomonosporaceae]MDL4775683.1 cytidylate kinase-like family protein [Actinomadura xylanilytica]